jgi:hypothetical protein
MVEYGNNSFKVTVGFLGSRVVELEKYLDGILGRN